VDAVVCEPSENGEAASLASCTEAADCIIDFSHHTATEKLLQYAVARRLPVVVATTGHTPQEQAAIAAAAQSVPMFYAANLSLGIAVLARWAQQAATLFPDADIEIIERHHRRKADAPSGTALLLAQCIRDARLQAQPQKCEKNNIGIHSLRLGNVVGEHEVVIATDTQILTLKHHAQSRVLFAEGALRAAGFLLRQAPGLYGMEDLLHEGDG
jgi:4-hydroxy-tetrahydrodipicolinate reductase